VWNRARRVLWADVAKAVPFDPDYRCGEGLEWLGRVADLVGPIEVCAEPLWATPPPRSHTRASIVTAYGGHAAHGAIADPRVRGRSGEHPNGRRDCSADASSG